MDTQVYLNMANVQETHWWFMARREILSSVIATIGLTKDSRILEIGCGPGGNLRMLGKHGQIEALEKNEFSREYAQNITGVKVEKGSLPNDIGSLSGEFDLICLFDVLEHIDKDHSALTAVRKLLKNSGSLLITVPAYQWLYGPHDMNHHHFRRYSKSDISEKSIRANFSIKRIGYFNCLLFPLLIILRMIDKLFPSQKSRGNKLPSQAINKTLHSIFRIERHILKRTNLPFGASIIILLEKERSAQP